MVVSITSWRQNGAKSNRRGRKRLGTSLCKPVAGSLPAPTRANLAEVQGSCTVIPVICERFDALCLLWNHGAISVKFVTVTLYKAIFNARRKEGSLRCDFHWDRSVVMKSLLNCSRYVWNNCVLSTRRLSLSHHAAMPLGSVAQLLVSLALRSSEN